jgi:hypothetical protein
LEPAHTHADTSRSLAEDFENRRRETHSGIEQLRKDRAEAERNKDKELVKLIDAEIDSLQEDAGLLDDILDGIRGLEHSDGEDEIVIKKIDEARTLRDKAKDAYKKVRDRSKGIELHDLAKDNEETVDRTTEILEKFWETYQSDRQTSLIMAIGGLILALSALVVGAKALELAMLDDKKKVTNPAAGRTNIGTEDQDELSEVELDDMMQKLVVNKAVIAAGQVPQERLWRNLAKVADEIDLDGQGMTLIFVQEAAVDLPGAHVFFWLDQSEAEDRYGALKDAYHKNKKLSDVYLAATAIRYKNKEVPLFHVALLLQCALRLIKHDMLDSIAKARA